MNEFTKTFKAISDPNRVRIIKMLEAKPLCVCEITSVLNISTSTVSNHLNILKDAGFIRDKKNGKWVDYSLNRSSDNPVLHQVLAMFPGWLNDNDIVNSDKGLISEADRIQICASLKSV